MYHCPICGGQLETTTNIKTGDSRAVVNICTNPQCWRVFRKADRLGQLSILIKQ